MRKVKTQGLHYILRRIWWWFSNLIYSNCANWAKNYGSKGVMVLDSDDGERWYPETPAWGGQWRYGPPVLLARIFKHLARKGSNSATFTGILNGTVFWQIISGLVGLVLVKNLCTVQQWSQFCIFNQWQHILKEVLLIYTELMASIPDVCQFWGTTTFFSWVKVHQKVRKFAKNSQNWPTFRVLCAKKGTSLKKFTTTVGGGGDKYEL